MLSVYNGECVCPPGEFQDRVFCYGCNEEVSISAEQLRILGGGGLGLRDCNRCRSSLIRGAGQ